MKQWLMPIIKIGVAFGLIYWLVQSGRFDLNTLKQISSPIVWIYGVLSFLLILANNSKRWQILLRHEDVNVKFPKVYKLSLMGIFFNFFMPGGVGGDVVKAGYLMGDYKQKKWFIGWSILVDRVFGLTALFLYSGVSGLVFYSHVSDDLKVSIFTISVAIVVGFFVLIGLLVLAPKEKIGRLLKSHSFLEKVLLPLFYFFEKPKAAVVPFLLSLVGQGIVIGMGAFLILFLGVDIPIWMMLLIFPFGFLATVLPISPAGVGVGQAAFYYLFEKIAGNGEFGVLVISYFQAVQFLVGILGGLVFVLYKKKKV